MLAGDGRDRGPSRITAVLVGTLQTAQRAPGDLGVPRRRGKESGLCAIDRHPIC